MNSPVAIITTAWGDYWDRFAAEFFASIERMDPQPAELIVVAESGVAVPSCRHVLPRSENKLWDWTNEGVEATQAEWVMIAGIDDPLFPDGLSELTLIGDLVATACIERGEPKSADRHEWDKALDIGHPALWTAAIHRRESFLRHPWRRTPYADWMQWVELRHANSVITFDRKPRFTHAIHETAHTYHYSEEGDSHVQELRRLLATGRVIPGCEWPPLTQEP